MNTFWAGFGCKTYKCADYVFIEGKQDVFGKIVYLLPAGWSLFLRPDGYDLKCPRCTEDIQTRLGKQEAEIQVERLLA